MTKVYIFTIFILFSIGACGASQDAVLEKKPEVLSNHTKPPNYELYDRYSKEMQAAYWAGDYDTVVKKLEEGFNLPHEGTTYDNYVFNAVKFWQVDEIEQAKQVLSDFRLMLKIDEGLVMCDVNDNSLRSQDNKEIINKVVYDEMCWEMPMSFYGQRNDSLNAYRDELKRIAADIEKKLNRG